jgi:hypothetical protein
MLQKIEHICGSVTFEQKRLTRHHKSIHLALEVKTFFDNSTPATGSSTKYSSQKPRLPTDGRQWCRRKRERERNLQTKSYKAKLVRLRSARLAQYDQAVNF